MASSASQRALGAGLKRRAPTRGARALGFADADTHPRDGEGPEGEVSNLKAAAGAAPHTSLRRRAG